MSNLLCVIIHNLDDDDPQSKDSEVDEARERLVGPKDKLKEKSSHVRDDANDAAYKR